MLQTGQKSEGSVEVGLMVRSDVEGVEGMVAGLEVWVLNSFDEIFRLLLDILVFWGLSTSSRYRL